MHPGVPRFHPVLGLRSGGRLLGISKLQLATVAPETNTELPRPSELKGCSLFHYNWRLPAYSWASLHTIVFLSSFACSSSFFAYSWSCFACSWSFFAYSGSSRVWAHKQTVSKNAPTVSIKTSPKLKSVYVSVISTLFLHSMDMAKSWWRAFPWFSDGNFPLSFEP